MLKGLKVSRLLIANMILFINISNLLKWKIIYVMTCSVAHWDTWDDVIEHTKDKCHVLYFSVQEEDILEHFCTL